MKTKLSTRILTVTLALGASLFFALPALAQGPTVTSTDPSANDVYSLDL